MIYKVKTSLIYKLFILVFVWNLYCLIPYMSWVSHHQFFVLGSLENLSSFILLRSILSTALHSDSHLTSVFALGAVQAFHGQMMECTGAKGEAVG